MKLLNASDISFSAIETGKVEEDDKHDYSNPQQGSICSLSNMMNELSTGDQTIDTTDVTVAEITQRPASKIPPTVKDSRKLFVGGLPSDITDKEFRDFFSSFGEIFDSVVMFDRETGRSRGFGFVTFVDPSICQHLLQLGSGNTGEKKRTVQRTGRLEMRGKIIEIKLSEPKQLSVATKRSARLPVVDNITAINSLRDFHFGRPRDWYNSSWTTNGQTYYQQSPSLPYPYVYPAYTATTSSYYPNLGFANSQLQYLETSPATHSPQAYDTYYVPQPSDTAYDYNGSPVFHDFGYLPDTDGISTPVPTSNTTTTNPVNPTGVNEQYTETTAPNTPSRSISLDPSNPSSI